MDNVPVLSVYTLPPSPPNWDRVGVFYVSFCVTWTTLVFGGMAFCWVNRRNPILRLRGLPLSFAAIAFLHLYWILGQITYPVGATMPIVLAYDVQYFFMGIWFPLGIALFHASNSRFLHVAKLQKQFTSPYLRGRVGCNGSRGSWLCRLRNLDYTKRIMIFIGFGMVIQVLLTVGMWLACRKYHPTYGIPGTELRGATLPEQLVDLGRGWEWWPSVLWQVVWTWIVAPVLIWRAWGIRDTMGWRTQTIGCCISNLHATPMFLMASYMPAFAPVNMYFSPSQWIHLSVLMFEIFTVFVPAGQVIRQMILAKRAAATNAKWETESQTTTLRESSSMDRKLSSAQSAEKGERVDYSDESLGDRLYTMSALNQTLDDNPGPLQDFSALSDFSGENIAFLTRLARWRASWYAEPTKEQRLEAYNRALEIYIDFISPRDAEFPLNLSSTDLKCLEDIFEKATRILYGEARVDPAVPFELPTSAGSGSSHGTTLAGAVSRVRYTGEVADCFGPGVFDDAESHIKYLVLTNTWPKFVKEMQSRRRSCETERSAFTTSSETTLASRVSSKVTQFIQSFV
ncbi:hypothetical protein NM208_g1792 [Fusarium decemcellulare]|uniref:Uncharacterized protein n=1 Tax=Fusarium decemcellulare TaxID=57161 RepID=A0ACC1SUX3_9HYPO|nr:hypothetical protein NM208_g1792 [Fusarium decemcellulare]